MRCWRRGTREMDLILGPFADSTLAQQLGPADLDALEALIAENVSLILVGSTRTDDIVRDADILHLYKKAG